MVTRSCQRRAPGVPSSLSGSTHRRKPPPSSRAPGWFGQILRLQALLGPDPLAYPIHVPTGPCIAKPCKCAARACTGEALKRPGLSGPYGSTLTGFLRGFASGRGGEGGIRTRDTLASMPHFECGAFNHSATSPKPPDLALCPGNASHSCRSCCLFLPNLHPHLYARPTLADAFARQPSAQGFDQ